MADIQLDAEKAERIIAQILRDEEKMLPAKANEIAATICRRLSSSMPLPTNQPLQSYRIISSSPPPGDGFQNALSQKIADVNYRVAHELWALVYDRGRDLPSSVADTRRF